MNATRKPRQRLVRLKVDVVVTVATLARSRLQATTGIPIVFGARA